METKRSNLISDVSDLILSKIVPLFVDFMKVKKDVIVTPEEICAYLNLQYTPRNDKSFTPKTSSHGNSKRNKEPPSDDMRCTYFFVKGARNKERCGGVRDQSTPGCLYCKSCKNKKGTLKELDSHKVASVKSDIGAVNTDKGQVFELDAFCIDEKGALYKDAMMNIVLHLKDGTYYAVGDCLAPNITEVDAKVQIGPFKPEQMEFCTANAIPIGELPSMSS